MFCCVFLWSDVFCRTVPCRCHVLLFYGVSAGPLSCTKRENVVFRNEGGQIMLVVRRRTYNKLRPQATAVRALGENWWDANAVTPTVIPISFFLLGPKHPSMHNSKVFHILPLHIKSVILRHLSTCYYCVLVHGSYSKWSDWSQCSQSCGRGKQYRIRFCTNPWPAHGGRDCSSLGSRIDLRTCYIRRCPGTIKKCLPGNNLH